MSEITDIADAKKPDKGPIVHLSQIDIVPPSEPEEKSKEKVTK
jgi:hypothetical protein